MAFANQSERDSIAVTYDLAIAKITMQLQAEESPKYDNVFVAMGSFHMELSMFGAIAKSEAPTKIDATVVDGIFFLHLLVDPPKSSNKLQSMF